jgi:hypothetical protein
VVVWCDCGGGEVGGDECFGCGRSIQPDVAATRAAENAVLAAVATAIVIKKIKKAEDGKKREEKKAKKLAAKKGIESTSPTAVPRAQPRGGAP